MFFASFLIGLREGLEAALIIGILIAYVTKLDRIDVKRKIWLGLWLAVGMSLGLGALFTFGRNGLSFKAQEIIGGSMSLLAVAMVTWMVFWMMNTGSKLKEELESSVDQALAIGTGWAIFWLAFVSVAREGIETTLMLWGWAGNLVALSGAVIGIILAASIGALLNRGMLRINLGVFFAWTGAFLILVSAGILAYGIHDLQEAAILPGPFSGAPITPTDFRTGEVLTGITNGPFWGAAFPFGWAFDLQSIIEPSGALAAFLKGTLGFVPLMSWLEITAWACYLGFVFPMFIRKVLHQSVERKAQAAAKSTALNLTESPADLPQPAPNTGLGERASAPPPKGIL